MKKDHCRAERPTDLPLTGSNGGDEKDKHKKEEHRGTDESTAADGRRSQTVTERVQEPWQWKPFMWKNTRERKTQNTRHCHALRRFLLVCDTSVCRILPHSDVKYVTARRAGDKHVRPASPCHDATGDQVRDGRPHGQNGKTYDRLRDAKSFTRLEAAKRHELSNTETGNNFVSAPQFCIPLEKNGIVQIQLANAPCFLLIM